MRQTWRWFIDVWGWAPLIALWSESTAAVHLEKECFFSLFFCSLLFTFASFSSPYDAPHPCLLSWCFVRDYFLQMSIAVVSIVWNLGEQVHNYNLFSILIHPHPWLQTSSYTLSHFVMSIIQNYRGYLVLITSLFTYKHFNVLPNFVSTTLQLQSQFISSECSEDLSLCVLSDNEYTKVSLKNQSSPSTSTACDKIHTISRILLSGWKLLMFL